jgi:hypothetical protein
MVYMLQQISLGVFTDNGHTVKDAWDLGTSPLRPSEAPMLKVTPAGELEKFKWRTTIYGSTEQENVHYHGSSHHAAPAAESVRYRFAAEANVPEHERCGQADVSSAYNIADVGVDGQGDPVCIFVRRTSLDDAVAIVKNADGDYTAQIGWQWFKQYRDTLLKKKASGKKIVPEIYSRYLRPNERVWDLTANTYGRKAGGRPWQDHMSAKLREAPLNAVHINTEAAWRHIPKYTTTVHQESRMDGMPTGCGDIQVHTNDMLIRPQSMYKYTTKVLQEQKGLKLTCSNKVDAHVGIKVVYTINDDGKSIAKMHAAFRPLIDARIKARRTEVQVPMSPDFRPTTAHKVDVLDKAAVCGRRDEDMAVSPVARAHQLDLSDAP